MTINFTQEDHADIASLYNYSDLTREKSNKALTNLQSFIESNDAPRYLYVIRCLPYNYYKIGITNDIKKRLVDHQTGCPFELKFIFAFEADMSDFLGKEIEYLEDFFHRNYANRSIRGEWFELTEKEITDMCLFLENDRDLCLVHSNAEEISGYFKAHEEMVLEEDV